MLHIEFNDPVVVARAIKPTSPLEATHHYCNAGRAADGSLIACLTLHPDRKRPAGSRLPVPRPGAEYPVYLFRPHPDYPWQHEYAFSRSTDNGQTWSPSEPTEGHNAVAYGDKTLSQTHRVWFVKPGLAVTCLLESDDGGLSWAERPDVLFRYPANLPIDVVDDDVSGTQQILNFENCNTLQPAPDGSLITFATAVRREGDVMWWFPALFRSTDGGYTFDFVCLPYGSDKPETSHGYTEPTLARMPNGDLLTVTRVEYHEPERVMMQSRSVDDGFTWTAPEVCAGIRPMLPLRRLPIVNEGKTHNNAACVSPDLVVLPNGIAVLTYGRPGQYVAFSENGGANWRDRIPVVAEESLFGINDETSAMAGLVVAGDDEAVLIYDVRNYHSDLLPHPANTVFALKMRVRSI